jgi:amino acid transporter
LAVGAGLAAKVLGFREVLFQSLAAIAPSGALAVSVPLAAVYSGGALPLAVILGLLPCLTVALSIGQLAKHLPSAGSIYTYPARALHPNLGFLVGWGYTMAAAAWGPTLALMTSVQVAALVTHGRNPSFQLAWMACFVVITFLILLLGYRGIGLSAGTGTVLGILETTVFVALAVTMILAAGKGNTAQPFTLRFANVKGYEGMAGVLAAAVFTVQAFVGFEAAAPLAEEAKDSKRTILVATLFACTITGALYLLTTYAAVVFRGPASFSSFGATLEQGNPWITLTQRVWGVGWMLIFLAGVSSNVGAQNAFSTAASRTLYAMARIRLFPSALESTHPRWRSPDKALIAQFVFTVVVGGIAALAFGPVDASILLATLCTVVPLAVYILINISCCAYYWREKRDEFRWLLHGFLPLSGAAVMIPILFTALGAGGSFLKFVTPLPWPISLTGPILIGWYSIGTVYLLWLARRFPQRLQLTTQIFSEKANTVSGLRKEGQPLSNR